MLPLMSPDDRAVVSASPPRGFRPLFGIPRNAYWTNSTLSKVVGASIAQKNGVRYEAQAQRHLVETLGEDYHILPRFHFEDDAVQRTLIPDGMWLQKPRLVLFEIKIQHMPEAWWQLRKLYEPVARRIHGVKRVDVVEVCRSYDPMMGFPEHVTVGRDLRELLQKPESEFKVYPWRP